MATFGSVDALSPTTTSMKETSATQPLIGDGKGVYRVQIVGNSGSGKSTLADELGRILGLPVIHLDRVFWRPGWTEPTTEEFVNRLRFQLNEYNNGWVIDGNYSSRLRGELDDVTDIIWLDTPFLLYFPRLVKRTLLRLVGLEVPCAPGCEETFRNIFLSRESILWFAITNHIPLRRRETKRLRTRGVHTGGIARRIGGWGNELNAWKRRVQELGKKHSV